VADAFTQTSTTHFSDLVQKLIRAEAEQELRGELQWANQAVTDYVPGRFEAFTNTYAFKRYADVTLETALADITLTQGTTPYVRAMTIDSESFTAVQYGKVLGIFDLAAIQNPDLQAQMATKVGVHAAGTINQIAQAIAIGGSRVIYANGSARSSVSTGIDSSDLRNAYATLHKAGVPTFSDGKYRAILTTEQGIALQSDTTAGGWLEARLYTNTTELLTGELGMYHGIRILDGGMYGAYKLHAGFGSVDVHLGWVFGPGAFALADMQELRTYYSPFTASDSDPLAQRCKVGWKWAGGGMLIAAAGERCMRIESTQTTL
jgi:N4-gp56 family major capsid protein